MFLVKVLEKKEVIRFFGISLILAPFINYLTKIAILNTVAERWTFSIFLQIFKTSAFSTQILSVGSVLIGALMLTGSQKAWRYTLFFLGCHIMVQLANFGPAYKASKISAVFFLINVAVFLFIADQLVWKVKARNPVTKGPEINPLYVLREAFKNDNSIPVPTRAPNRPTAAPVSNSVPTSISSSARSQVSSAQAQSFPSKPAQIRLVESQPEAAATKPVAKKEPLQTSKVIPIQFEGFGSWAKLSQITPEGIYVRSLSELPFEFGNRQIVVQFTNGLDLRLRFSKREGSDYFFEYVDLSKDQIQKINSWLKRVA